jgi:hypothetical protein
MQAYNQCGVGSHPSLQITQGCTRLGAARLPVACPWSVVLFGYSSTTKTGRHAIAEILLKVSLKHQKSKSKSNVSYLLRSIFILDIAM